MFIKNTACGGHISYDTTHINSPRDGATVPSARIQRNHFFSQELSSGHDLRPVRFSLENAPPTAQHGGLLTWTLDFPPHGVAH